MIRNPSEKRLLNNLINNKSTKIRRLVSLVSGKPRFRISVLKKEAKKYYKILSVQKSSIEIEKRTVAKNSVLINKLINIVSQYAALKLPLDCSYVFESGYNDSILVRLVNLDVSKMENWLIKEIEWFNIQISIL